MLFDFGNLVQFYYGGGVRPLRREVIFSMIFSCKVLYIFIVVLYNIIYLSHPKSMADLDPVWPLNADGVKSGQIAKIELNEEENEEEKMFFITPGGNFPGQRTSFTISSISSESDPASAERFLTKILKERSSVLLTVGGKSQNITIENIPGQHNSSILNGSYYLTQILSPGDAAKRGGRSIRSHYRKRKSNRRRESNKKYSAGRGRRSGRRSRRVRRSRKN